MISIFKKILVELLTEVVTPPHVVSVDANGLFTKTPFEANPVYTIDIVANQLKLYKNAVEVNSMDLSIYLDDTNLARLVSGVLDESTGIVTFTRDDSTTFTIDMSSLIGVVGGVANRHLDIAALITDQPNQTNREIHYVDDASGDYKLTSGYGYYEYLGTTNGDMTDYVLISSGSGSSEEPPAVMKLFLTVNSTDVNWGVILWDSVGFNYQIIDNNDGSIIDSGFYTGQFFGYDLSATSGDVSVYIDDLGINSTVDRFYDNPSLLKPTYIDFSLIPNINNLFLSNAVCTCISSSWDLLTSLTFYGGTWTGLDFSSSTKLTFLNLRFTTTFITPLDISNNPDITYLRFSQYHPINVSNHRKLQTLWLSADHSPLDPNINTTYLPDLRVLYLWGQNEDYDLTVRDLSLITSLYINATTLIGLNTLVNIIDFHARLYSVVDLSVIPSVQTIELINTVNVTIDLRLLVNLTSFNMNYYSALMTNIYIDNGLNSQITKFQRIYGTDTNIVDVTVDNPIDANNEVSPYLPTVWVKDYLTTQRFNWI